MFEKSINITASEIIDSYNSEFIYKNYPQSIIKILENDNTVTNDQIYCLLYNNNMASKSILFDLSINKLTDDFKNTSLRSRNDKANLLWKYYKYHKDDVAMVIGIYKMLTFGDYMQYTGNFEFNLANFKILIEKYQITTEEYIELFNNIGRHPSTNNRFNCLVYIYEKIKNLNLNANIDTFSSFINYIDINPEFVVSLFESTFDVDKRSFSSGNFMSSLTLIEKLIDIAISKNIKTLGPLIEESIKKSKDISKHKNISYQNLIGMDILSDSTIKLLVNNCDNLLNMFGNYNQKTVTINAMDPLSSVTKYIQQPETMNTFWKIKYEKQSGIDGGGLIRDFYYILGDEIKKCMSIIDNYYYINKDNKNDTSLWFSIGLMFGKMFVIEKLPCGINLHPYLLYRITHPEFESTKMIMFDDNWFNDIENIKSIRKLQLMDNESWNNYVKVSGDSITCDQMEYCNQLILNEYENQYQPALNEFIYGFWSYADAMLLKHFNNAFVGKKICGSLEYDIISDKPGSIQYSLGYDMNDKYLNGLLNAIEKINKEDNDKIQKLFRFWFGSPYIDLTNRKISIDYGYKKEVFEAHTCYYQLVLPNRKYYPDIINDEQKCTEFMEQLIENTLYNQDLADKHNLHTQYV